MKNIHLNTLEDLELNEMSWTKILLDNLQNVANDNDSESDHQSNPEDLDSISLNVSDISSHIHL